jgi:hypothetical protein
LGRVGEVPNHLREVGLSCESSNPIPDERLSSPSPNTKNLERVGVRLGSGRKVPPPPPPLRRPKKKSGGQPCNSNAWKHGFYARSLSPSESNSLPGDEADQLRHEETLLRILTRRTWLSMRPIRASLPWHEVLFTVRTIGYAVFVIAKLQRARRRFFGDRTDLEKDIQLGLSEACADLGILDYFKTQVNK